MILHRKNSESLRISAYFWLIFCENCCNDGYFRWESVTFADKSREQLDILNTFVNYLIEADTRFTLSVNSVHTPFWDVFMLLFSSKNIWFFFYAGLIWFLFRNYSWRFSVGCLLAIVVLITFCDQVSSSWLRPIVQRLRPCDPENPLSDMVHLVDGYRPVSYSCPSAHASNTWGLAFFLSLVFRRKLLSLTLFAWAFITCWSRLYLGVHFFGDLLAGMIVGGMTAFVVYRVMVVLVKVISRRSGSLPERTSLTTVPEREQWVPIAMLLATMALMLAYAAYRCWLS